MSQVSVTINGRHYRMACEDGQENHLMKLAETLDQRIQQLRNSFGEIGDSRLTVMAALTISDELAESTRKIRLLEQEIASLQDARVAASDRVQLSQAAIVSALNSAAERIESITRSLNQTVQNAGTISVG